MKILCFITTLIVLCTGQTAFAGKKKHRINTDINALNSMYSHSKSSSHLVSDRPRKSRVIVIHKASGYNGRGR